MSKQPLTRHDGASQKVLEYLRQHANVEVPSREISSALDFPDFTVSNSIGYLIANRVPITRVMKGVVIYHSGPRPQAPPQPPPVNKLYEFVGTSSGRTIVKGEDDELYVIQPLFGA